MGIVRKTAVIVPCYNEEKRIRPDEFLKFASACKGVAFIFVNDGSSDRTGELLKKLCSKNPAQFALFDMTCNSGKAEAVRQGFLKAFEQGFEIIGFWDADLASPLSCIPEFISLIESGKNIVIGSRIKLLGREIERQALRHYLGRVFATAASVILRLPVYDTQCGAKLFRKNSFLEAAMSKPFNVKWIFDVELLARIAILEEASGRPLFHKSWMEVPLPEWKDVKGSKVRPADFLKSGGELIKLISFFHSSSSRKKYLERLCGPEKAVKGLKGARS